MTIDFDQYSCEFCGKKSTNVVFAAFVCGDPECVEKARLARGGPGGHMKKKINEAPITPIDLLKN
ncbi:MAG: threonine aldolase family protein [archaeon]|nr:threonine aldolase family protein [archaeon]